MPSPARFVLTSLEGRERRLFLAIVAELADSGPPEINTYATSMAREARKIFNQRHYSSLDTDGKGLTGQLTQALAEKTIFQLSSQLARNRATNPAAKLKTVPPSTLSLSWSATACSKDGNDKPRKETRPGPKPKPILPITELTDSAVDRFGPRQLERHIDHYTAQHSMYCPKSNDTVRRRRDLKNLITNIKKKSTNTNTL